MNSAKLGPPPSFTGQQHNSIYFDMQWPQETAHRIRLCSHWLHTINIPHAELLDIFSKGLRVTEDSTIQNTILHVSPEFNPERATKIGSERLLWVAVYTVCSYEYPVIMVSFVQSKTVGTENLAFWNKLWGCVKTIAITPETIVNAMQCLRPDLQWFICGAYVALLYRFQSLQQVDRLLNGLIEEPWHFRSYRPSYKTLRHYIQRAQMVCVTTAKQLQCSFTVDDVKFSLSRRDHILLALLLLYDASWIRDTPEDAPDIFKTLPRELTPQKKTLLAAVMKHIKE